MKPMVLDRAIAYAAGHDAGNRSMRKAGRKKWSLDDRNVAAKVTNDLLYLLEPPAIQAAIRRDEANK